MCLGQVTPSKFDKNCPLLIRNQTSTISMHIPSLGKVHWCLLKLSSGNKIWACLRQITVKIWQNLLISNPKPDLYNINAHTKLGENPFMFTHYHPETGYGQMYHWRTDRYMDVQRETIIPRHYRVQRNLGNCCSHISKRFYITTTTPPWYMLANVAEAQLNNLSIKRAGVVFLDHDSSSHQA